MYVYIYIYIYYNNSDYSLQKIYILNKCCHFELSIFINFIIYNQSVTILLLCNFLLYFGQIIANLVRDFFNIP